MEKNIKVVDENTIEIDGEKYYAHERDATCVCNYCEFAIINCNRVPCKPSQRKDGRNVYFTKKHLDMEKRIIAPEGCEIEKIELIDGAAVVTFREKERKLPKSWEEFCDTNPIKDGEVYLSLGGAIDRYRFDDWEPRTRKPTKDINTLPDRATAEAVLALCQLIQLRNCYNGDWVPDWSDYNQDKYTIEFHGNEIFCDMVCLNSTILYFKTEELRDEFLRNFRPLIEKLKPIYGIKEGGEE